MPEEQTFDDLVSDFSATVQRVERVIEDSAPKERATMERRLNEILRTVSHLNPLGERSPHARRLSASEGGVYSQVNIDPREPGPAHRSADASARSTRALRETGLSSAQVVSRIEGRRRQRRLGAAVAGRGSSHTIARTDNLDLSKKERARAGDRPRLDDVHAPSSARCSPRRACCAIDGVVHDEDGPENDAAPLSGMRRRCERGRSLTIRLPSIRPVRRRSRSGLAH